MDYDSDMSKSEIHIRNKSWSAAAPLSEITRKCTSDGAQLVNMVESLIIPSTKRISMIQLLYSHLIEHVTLLMLNLGIALMETRASLPIHHPHMGPYGPQAANTACPDAWSNQVSRMHLQILQESKSYRPYGCYWRRLCSWHSIQHAKKSLINKQTSINTRRTQRRDNSTYEGKFTQA